MCQEGGDRHHYYSNFSFKVAFMARYTQSSNFVKSIWQAKGKMIKNENTFDCAPLTQTSITGHVWMSHS